MDDETFGASLTARNLPLDFNTRLWAAHRDLVLKEMILDTSKLSLDHPIFTYELNEDSETYRQLVHYHSLLHKKTGIFSFEYKDQPNFIYCLAPKNYLISFHETDTVCKAKGARIKNNPSICMSQMENRFLELIVDQSIYRELKIAHFQFKIMNSRTYYQSFKKVCANNCVSKAFQIGTSTHPYGYWYLSNLRTSFSILQSILKQLPD